MPPNKLETLTYPETEEIISTINGEIETSQAVTSKWICTTLENYGTWLVCFDNLGNDLHIADEENILLRYHTSY